MNRSVSHRTQFGLALCIGVLLAGCSGSKARHDRAVERGQDYFKAGNYEKARVEFRNALQIVPTDPDARYMAGRVAEKLNNIREAASDYQGAIDVNADHIGARAALGRIYVYVGAPDKALQTIAPSFAKHATDPELLVVHGAANQLLGKSDQALADAELANKLDPSNERAVGLLAGMYRQRQEPDRAIALLDATLKRVPESVDLRQVLAAVYASTDKNDLAEAQYRTIVKSRPKDMALRQQLALLYLRDKKVDAAEALLRDGIAQDPDNDQLKLSFVGFLGAQRSPDAGEKALREFIAQKPDDTELLSGLAGLQLEHKDVPGAVATYESVIRKDGHGAQGLAAQSSLAALEIQQGDVTAAGKRIAEVLKYNPHDNRALMLRSELSLQHSDPTSAITDLRTVLRDQPESVGVMRILARAYQANGDLGLAEEILRTALKHEPRDAAIRMELAQVLLQTKQSAQAIEVLEEAVRLEPGNVTLRQALTRADLEANQLEKARLAAADLQTLAPALADGPYLAGMVALRQKRDADAEKSLLEAERLQPKAVEPLAALAQLDVARGKSSAAIARIQAFLDQQGKIPPVYNMLGEIELQMKDLSAARKAFEAAQTLAPKWWLPIRNLALTQLASGERPAAIATLRGGLTATDQEPALASALADLLEHDGKADEAIATYESVLSRHPHDITAANNLAMLLVSYRKDEKSLARAKELSAGFAATHDANLLDTFGWVRVHDQDKNGSLRALEQAVELDPSTPVLRYHLGVAQLQAGMKDRARENLQRAVSAKEPFTGADEARAALASLQRTPG